MIAELLLCGIASANIGFDTGAKNNHLNNVNESAHISSINIEDFENAGSQGPLKAHVGGSGHFDGENSDIISESGFVDKSTNTWKDTVMDNDDNNGIYDAQLISPLFKNSDAASFCNNLEINVVGSLYKKSNTYDEDFYRFILYGKASIELTLQHFPRNYSIQLYSYDYSNAKNVVYSPTLNDFTSYSCTSKTVDGFVEKSINMSAKPGNYYLRVYSPDKNVATVNDTYTVCFKAKYTSGKYNESITNLIFNKGINCATWISDFDPFFLKSFEQMERQSYRFINYRKVNEFLIENDVQSKKYYNHQFFFLV